MDASLRELVQTPVDGSRIVFRGTGGSSLNSLLHQRCRYLLENSAAGEGMLIIAGSRDRLIEWESELRHIYPVEPRICTFHGFVRQELEVFYQLAAAKCKGLARTEIRPAFLDRDAAVNLVAKVVQHRREKDGIFSSLTSTSEKIASDILTSLDSAAMAGIPFDEVFDRLYSSIEIQNEVRRKIYKEAGEIASDYRSKCLELGVLDMAASVELYCGYLFRDESYGSLLKEKIKYLIGDDIQGWDKAQLSTAELLLPGLRSCAFSYAPEAVSGRMNRLRRNSLIEDRVIARCDVISAGKNEAALNDLSETLYNAIVSGKISKTKKGVMVERHPATELRSEMLELIGQRIIELIDVEGVKPSDITILSSYADIVTELVLAGVLRSKGHSLTNLALRDKASGSRLCKALLVFTVICHPGFGIYPSRDDVRLLIEMLFGLDPVRASALARKACNNIPNTVLPGAEWPGLTEILGDNKLKDYLYVTAWIEEHKKASEPGLEVFLQKALLEIFLKKVNDESEIMKAKQLIDRAWDFCGIVSRFGMNAERDFLSTAGYRMDVGESLQHNMVSTEAENVFLATVSKYLESGLKSRVTVICGLGSNNWSPSRLRELVNPEVLSAAWKPGEVYAAENEESDRRLYLADIMRAVIRNCGERLITFESLLSSNGYENEGILPEIFDTIL